MCVLCTGTGHYLHKARMSLKAQTPHQSCRIQWSIAVVKYCESRLGTVQQSTVLPPSCRPRVASACADLRITQALGEGFEGCSKRCVVQG